MNATSLTRVAPTRETITTAQIDLVQSSFAKVVPIADVAADLFYNRLFEIALLRTHIGEQPVPQAALQR